jgi:hypothetical protein
MEKCKCGKRKYGYGDGFHEVWICYSCGSFDGKAQGDEQFIDLIMQDPNVVLALIKTKTLIPISD